MIGPKLRLLITGVVSFLPPLAAAVAATDVGFSWLFGAPTPSVCSAPNPVALDACRTAVRVELVAVAFAVKIGLDFVEYQFPYVKLEAFRRETFQLFLGQILKDFEAVVGATPGTCRINVMVPKRAVVLLLIGKVFRFEYLQGFDSSAAAPQNHRDRALLLFGWQGIAGEAVRKGEVFSQLVGTASDHWRMWKWQMDRTGHVKWVLSVPMFFRHGHTSKDVVRGVINLDVTDDVIALAADRAMKAGQLNGIVDKLLKTGALLAKLW